jgi:hypothetical protein
MRENFTYIRKVVAMTLSLVIVASLLSVLVLAEAEPVFENGLFATGGDEAATAPKPTQEPELEHELEHVEPEDEPAATEATAERPKKAAGIAALAGDLDLGTIAIIGDTLEVTLPTQDVFKNDNFDTLQHFVNNRDSNLADRFNSVKTVKIIGGSGITFKPTENDDGGIAHSSFTFFNGFSGLETIDLSEYEGGFADHAFKDTVRVKQIAMPSSGWTLTDYMFQGCVSLIDIDLTNCGPDFGAYAFEDCIGITAVKLPGGVDLSEGLFKGCTGLEKVYAGDAAPNAAIADLSDFTGDFAEEAFFGCTALIGVELPDKAIPARMFEACHSLRVVAFPDGAPQAIDDSAFTNTYPKLILGASAPMTLWNPNDLAPQIAGGTALWAGENLRLEVLPAAAAPYVTYQWKKGEADIGAGYQYEKAGVGAGDAGSYVCELTFNGEKYVTGQVSVSVTTVTINYADGVKTQISNPRILTEEATLTVASIATMPTSTAANTWLEGKTMGLVLDITLDPPESLPVGNKLTLVIALPENLRGNYDYYILHIKNDGTTEPIDSIYDSSAHTLTFSASSFSPFIVAYTPKPAVNPDGSGGGASSGGGSSSGGGLSSDGGYFLGGGSSGYSGSYSTGSSATGRTWLNLSDVETMKTDARKRGNDYAQSRSQYGERRGITREALRELGRRGFSLRHDVMDGNAVALRLSVPEPGAATKDIMLSGTVYGDDVLRALDKFEARWPGKRISAIALDHAGSFGMTVQVAAKADLSRVGTENLYLYAYDSAIPGYRRIGENYRIDANGYLHFSTNLGGEIAISNGPLPGTTGSALAQEGSDAIAALPPSLAMQNPPAAGEGNVLANYTPVPAVTPQDGESAPQDEGAPLSPEDIALETGPESVPANASAPERQGGFSFDLGALPETAKLSVFGLAMLILAAAFSAWGAVPWKRRKRERLVI